MSSRIHEIAKQYNVEPKDMLSWLKEQGYVAADTKSVSSTVSKIYYDEIEKKYGKPAAPVAAPAPAPAVVEAPTIRLPAGVFVKSVADITREKEEAAKAVAAARAATLPAAPVAAPKPPPPSPAPAMRVPPPPPPMAAPRFAPSSPAPLPVRAPVAAPLPAPRPAPVALSAMNKAPVSPPMPAARPLTPSTQIARTTSLPPTAAAPSASNISVTEEGGVKVIHLKPPIIVREFAVALGLKPFKLISELMEMSIFASMNQSIDESVATKVAEKHGFLLDIKHRGEAAVPVVTPEKAKINKEEKAREEDIKNLAPRPDRKSVV